MNCRVAIPVLALSLFPLGSFLRGADPVVNVLGGNQIREQGRVDLTAFASDPDGDPVDLTWTIFSDPTGKALLMTSSGYEAAEVHTPTVRVGVAAGSTFPEPSLSGQVVVRLVATDGTNEVTVDHPLTVSGVNRKPVLAFNKTNLGTFQSPRLTGEGFGIDATESYDPDGTAVKFLWRITNVLGGQSCSAALVLFGKETDAPGFPVPQVSSPPSRPMAITLTYLVEDGLNIIEGTVTGYVATPGGCSANKAPVVGASANPSVADFGESVTLNGTASDPGDTLTYSWVQLGTTTGVSLSTPQQKSTTFLAPNHEASLQFLFTATDSHGASASDTVTVSVVAGGGGGASGGGDTGGGDAGGGDSGEGQQGISEGTTACNQFDNEPAIGTVPALVTISSGKTVEIQATNAHDPDETSVFINGQISSEVLQQWRVVNGAGVLSNSDLRDRYTSRVSFDTSASLEDTTVLLEFLVSDVKGCGTRYPVEVLLKASQNPNQPPQAKLSYEIEEQGDSPAGTAPVSIISPAVILLDASQSTDEGSLSFAFELDDQLESGDASLEQVSDDVYRLLISDQASGTVTARVTVSDEEGLSDSAEVSFQVEVFNAPPDVVVKYQTNSDDSFRDYIEEAVEIGSPNSVLIDASESVDEGPLTINFVLQQSLLAGGVHLSQEGESSARLEIDAGTQGSATVLVTVTDDSGQSDSLGVAFQIADNRSKPVASVTVLEGESPMEEDEPVREGTIVTLDASDSRLANGDQPTDMNFKWTQVSGDPVNLRFEDEGRIARFRAPEVESDLTLLEFRLVVEYQGLESNPESVLVHVELPPLVYAQAAFGPYQDLRFRTVLVLINPGQDELQFRVEFFSNRGQPLDVLYENEIWDDQAFRSLNAGESLRLRFAGVDSERTDVGWARVTATRPLRGLVLYQLIDAETEGLDSEVSLFSSPVARHLSSFFDKDYSLALALVNPGEVESQILVQVIDPELGPDLPVASKVLVLGAGEQFSGFLDDSFFPGLPDEFKTGTLVIQAVTGKVAATLLKTNARGVAISSLPVVEEKESITP